MIKISEFKVQPVIDYKVREYCILPYPGHPKGCPMFGTRPECPPQAPLFEDYFDMGKEFVAVVCEFNLAKWMADMKELHPHWTERQQRNPLYWQQSVRKRLRDKCIDWLMENEGKNLAYTLIPEAMGLVVMDTMKAVGVEISFPPQDFVRKVAIIGTLRR